MIKIWKRISKSCSQKLFDHFYKKYRGGQSPEQQRALMRFQAESICDKQLAKFNSQQLKSYIAYLEEWNKSLPTPVVLEGDLNQYTTQDWLQVEKLLCKTQLACSSYRYIPEAYKQLQQGENLQLKATYDVMWSSAIGLNTLCGVVPFALGITLRDVLTSTGVMFESAVRIGILCAIFGTIACLSLAHSFLQGPSMGKIMVDGLSNTWEEVFQEKTLFDALLVGRMAAVLSRIAIENHDFIDFTTLSPRDVYILLATYERFTVVNDKYKALVHKTVSPLESFQVESSTYEPIKVPKPLIQVQEDNMQEPLNASTRT